MPLAVLVTLLLALTGCTAAPEPARPGVLRVGIGEPAGLLPADIRDQAGRTLVGALWTPLVDYDAATGKITPRAAESISSTDQTIWEVKLRPGGRFHDGTPVTAKSYVDTWRTVAAERWTGSGALTTVLRPREFDAPDDLTLRIVLDRPFGQVPAVLAAPALLPLPASVLASRDWAGFAANPIGNGPFRMVEPWRPGSGGRLLRVEEAPGKAREIEFRVGDAQSQFDRVRAGSLDLATEVPGARHDAMHRDFADRHAMWPLPEAAYLAFPSGERFQDAAVRHGFAMAVDRAALAAGPLANQVDPARTILPPGIAPGERSGTCRPCTHDLPAAQSLLNQAAFASHHQHHYLPVYFGAREEHWALPLIDQIRTALALDIVARPRGDESAAPADGPYTLTRSLTTPSPHEPLTLLAGATGYTDEGFTQLLALADAARSPEESAQLYRLAENQLLRDLPIAPLWSAHGHAVWAERVRDVSAAPLRGVDLASISV
ncbi:ABC transporter substrate-binding protein [Nocardia sp. CDC159]|uniref:ABC transporter substrate-binding protein n=1 Tax=Nocardia pulmonis TaxID=2951408 RepID=A0A9X2E3U4_9NOCA|nr:MULTISPECIES: ABC transporter substrate-binding protein [Nocardia]MCM6773699.1 ABC transporter substrate-binding protein [Nocardia pulmonis]MCM6786586.1 ABC transporter substrate-binding protein [Nocardia sp. CDC159]